MPKAPVDHTQTSPEAIAADPRLSREEKIARLEDRRHDLMEQQVATEENMPDLAAEAPGVLEAPGNTADLLRRTQDCLRKIRNQGETGSSDRTGERP